MTFIWLNNSKDITIDTIITITVFIIICVIYRVSYAEINGTRYSSGSILLCTFYEDNPIFGEVADILITDTSECLFILNPYISTNYNSHFNSYEVEPLENEKIVCQHGDLADYHLLSISKSFDKDIYNKNFVCLKHHVFE